MDSNDSRETKQHPLKNYASQDGQQPPTASTSSEGAAPQDGHPTASTSSEGAALQDGHPTASTSSKGAAPQDGHPTASTSSEGAAPQDGHPTASTSSKGTASQDGHPTASTSSEGAAPQDGHHTASTSSEGAAPQDGHHTASTSSEGAAPQDGHPTASTSSKGAASQDGHPTASTSSEGAAPQDGHPTASTSSEGAAPRHDANSKQANSFRSYSEAAQRRSPNVTNANNSAVSIPREKCTHKVEVHFKLYVQHIQAEEVDIIISYPSRRKQKYYLLFTEKIGHDCYLWQTSVVFDSDPNEVRYRYHLFSKGNKSYFRPFGMFLDTEDIDETETWLRRINSSTQYDTFYFRGDNRYNYETLPQSTIFYTEWLLHDVQQRTIKDILMQIESMKFSFNSSKLVKQSVENVLKLAANPSSNDFQCLYLSVVLGHLAKNNFSNFAFPFDSKTKSTIDRLLYCFGRCAQIDLLPNSSLGILEEIAPFLVNACSNPGWLTLAAYFYPYLGLKYVVRAKMTSEKYHNREYQGLLSFLLPVLVKEEGDDDETKRLHRRLMLRVLQTAPNHEAVLSLYKNSDLDHYLTSMMNKEDLFIDFYQSSLQSARNFSQGDRLIELTNIPTQLRTLMLTQINATMLEFLKSSQEPKTEHLQAFQKLITCLPPKSVTDVLKALSKSKSPPYHNLLLNILSRKEFDASWRRVSPSDKVNICSAWIDGMLRAKPNGENGKGKTTAAYEAVKKLMSSLYTKDEALIVEVCNHVAERILQNVDVTSILRSFKSIENFPEIIQECYKDHVRRMLQKQPRLVLKMIEELNRSSSSYPKQLDHFSGPILSRLGQDLLLCVLEVMEIPADKKSGSEEDDFKEMLDWSNVWVILLKAKGCVEKLRNSKKFKDGLKKWQAFASCVRNGNVSFPFLSDIEKHENNLSSICALARSNGHKATESELSKEKEIIKNCISELSQVQKDCSEKFTLLKLLISYCKTVSQDTCTIDGIPELIQEFNDREKSWKTQQLAELRDECFWGPLQHLLSPAKALKRLTKSASFTTVAKICLDETVQSQGSPTVDEVPKEVPNYDFQWLATFLTGEVIERFQSQWNPVFSDPGSLTMETMKTVLGNLKSKKQLQEEFNFLEKYFRRDFPINVKLYISDYVKFPSVLKQVKNIIALLDTFGLINATDITSNILTSFISDHEYGKDVSLKTVHESMLAVRQILSGFAEDVESVAEELGSSKKLVSFLTEIIDEDIRFLIDAVEEHSDQFVSESSVSDLIDVHGFLAPLIKNCEQGSDAQTFLATLKSSCKVYKKDMAVKLNQCSTNVNSLKGLYTSVANRGEITKEIIANGLKKGVYSVELRDGLFDAKMSYVKDDNQSSATYSLSELHDLRSRAHLIVNSDKNVTVAVNEKDDINFADFIRQVNLLTEITILLSELRPSGYVKYRKFWKKMKGSDALQATKDKLQEDLETWDNILSNAREQYYLLNYYRSDQLCVLHDFLTNLSQGNCEDVLSLIHFVDPNITKEQLEEYRKAHPVSKEDASSENPHEMISIIGNALDEIFQNTKPVMRPILDDQGEISLSHSKFDATVKSGELFVASLEAESPLTANVMLTLYQNTSNAFPEPYQVVFCGPQTGWEEIHLVLQRCFSHSKHLQHNSLFCIANVELLANEVQFSLVNVIKKMQNGVDGSGSSEENADYRLALICRGGDHHHIVEQFSQYSHHIAGMSDLALSLRLRSQWPEVKVITSSLPGLGKTERVREEALEKNMNVVTFSISGPLDQNKLIQRLKKISLKRYDCLHLDVGEVSDPLWLDTFLFQLIVTGMVSSGTQLFHLLTTNLYIEIANTLKDWLRESFAIFKDFTRVHLEWENYKDFLVSSEVTSDVQVVCQYFNAFDLARLESEDIRFTGQQKVKPLPANRCQELLQKYYSSDAEINFTALNTFLGVLADQLLKFSKSAFFKIANLKCMLDGAAQGVRTNLFRALLDVSKEFASRAITTCRSSHSKTPAQKESAEALEKPMALFSGMSAQHMVERVEGMIQWEDSNHLLVVFHGANSQAIAAVYRNRSLVPQNVEKLLKSQVVRGKSQELEDFKVMSQEQLQEKLEKIACTKLVKKCEENLYSSYALTPDNILKMILIILRVRANAPVIIMGETGCGKTSLVRYLANTCQIKFYIFNFHAGITEEEIIKFIVEMQTEARENSQQIWVFLDEINTCNHLGLISDVMCHHSLLGRQLPKNLVFLAACNPYKLRPKEQIKTAGLQGKNITDEYSGLVYRVHPLPESMIDYVWDYGSLAPNDEKAYIHRMVSVLPKKYANLLVNVLADSQKFIREAERNHFCVSLRDVYRCILLIRWFQKMIHKREEVKSTTNNQVPKHLRKYYNMSTRYDQEPVIKSIVLALAHCYLSRLPTDELRRNYRDRMITLFCGNGTMMTTEGEEKVDSFSAIVRMEEEDYLDRMDLPPGTARNAALRENVFVMLVCILNRIPIFVVGKPGCSKSLSIQLIRSNLRGRDSKDPLFLRLPQLYVVSYQGSESSTSEGIIKVFDKARKYKSHDKDGNVLPVVLLDEVGLAENSKYNPLKVLHSLLEPGDGKLPDVAVVGISNWSLDAAKMNRAIHLSRPEPTRDDLYETGHSLLHANAKYEGDHGQGLGKEELQCLAESYFEYHSEQKYANFHGLRDYYSLIKSISLSKSSDLEDINLALQRNFGGIPGELTNIQKIFLDKLKTSMLSSGEGIIPVTKLIQENLVDPLARHLMLITSGDSAIGILNQSLKDLKKETITIFGSRFEEDLSEDYNYRILSRIILCMERDCILILRDLESIYGSLYDMLNQNYAVVGKRKNCRVALGAYSNPMCQVNDGFRCIVLTDHHKLDLSDPPFLNRFEKQLLRFSDVLNEKQRGIITELRRWVKDVSTIQGLESHFKESDMFIGFHEDTLPSLVLLHSHGTEESDEEIINKCKEDLMWVAAPDGVLRAQKCNRVKEEPEEIKILSDKYFRKPIHQGLASFIETMTSDQETPFLAEDEIGSKTIVMTFSNIHTDISKCLGDTITNQTERLSAYKSEKQLAERVNNFWSTSDAELLVLQCKPELDGAHLLLARSIIEDKRSSHEQTCRETGLKQRKHVCIVVHVQRGTAHNDVPWQFSFLCGWKQVFLDVLEEPPVSLNEIRTESVQKLLMSSIWPLRKIAQNELLWCFTRIKYTRHQRPLDSILSIAKNFLSSENVFQAIEKLVLQWVNNNADEKDEETGVNDLWQVKVACDRQSLINSSTLYGAMEHHVSRLVREPLAKIIYFLEKENAWPPHVHDDAIVSNFEEIWCYFLSKDTIFKLSEIPKPLGAETYNLDSLCLDLRLPFSQVVMRKVDGVKDLFLEDYAQVKENESNLDNSGELTEDAKKQQVKRYSEIVLNAVPEIKQFPISCCDSYMSDLFDIMSADFNTRIKRHQRVSAVKAAFISNVKNNLQVKEALQFYVQLHIFVWIHKEQILDQLRMVDCCQPFVSSEVLPRLADEFLSSNAFVHDINDVDCPNDENNLNDETEEDDGSEDESNAENKKSTAQSYADECEENENKEQSEKEAVEGSDGSDEEEQGEEKCFEEMLVTVYCEAMLPSQETVEKRNNGPETWIRNASLLLSLAFKISDQSPAFHFLRLCVDFAKIFGLNSLTPENDLFPLYILNEIGDALKPGYLDTDESFQKITKDLIKPLEEKAKDESVKNEALQKFSALFYGRCIDTNVDTCGARPIVEHVLLLDCADLVLMMGPVIRHLLVVEEIESRGIFVDIITNPGKIEKCPCLQNIDEVFKDFFEQEFIHHDSYAAVMIADLIQSLLKFEDNYSIEDIDSSDCELLKSVNGATKVLSESNENNCGLVVLSAVAFLRAFFTMLSRFIDDKKAIVMKGDSPYSGVMNEINSLLSAAATGDTRKRSLQFFFLKQLYQKMSLFGLRKLCCESETLPSIKNIWDNVETCADKAEFVSVCKLSEYQRVKVAYCYLMEENETEMVTIVKECQDSSNLRLAVLGVLVNMVYLKRTVKKLTDKEERVADWFAEKITQFPTPLKELLRKITGREDFPYPQLQLSPESSVEEVEVALLILHVSCVIASGDHGEQSPIYQYFSNPVKCKSTFILANGQERMYRTFENRQPANGPSPLSCPCGLRVMFENDDEDNICPSCTDSIQPVSGTTGDCNAGKINSEKGYFPVPAKELSQKDIRMENMNSAVFRALHLIVHASLYAGVAVKISTTDDLSSLLNLEDQSSEKGHQDPVQFCFDHVTTDLSSLVTILECKQEIAFKVMHLVVEKCTHLIRGEPLGNNTCLTLKQRSDWEVSFSKLTEGILREALGSSKGLKQEMRMQQNPESEESSIQNHILELDEYASEPSQQKQQLKRLFRVTRQPTFTDFRATFVSSPKDIQKNHSFLSLFFAKSEELPIIGKLYHLLKWARLVSSALTHRISRKEAQIRTIDDFIHGHLLDQARTQDETDNQKKLFENFKNAWNDMRQLVNEELDQEKTEQMPRLKKTDNIAYCLTESDSGVYLLTAIRILVSLQNSFLDEMLPLSALRKHPALRFLEKDNNCSGISSISIQQVKEKEIINFQWSDELFKYAQNNPEYGHGEEIVYDFERIEIELANKLAFGKSHLIGSLNRFIFAKELFHSCAPLLTEIRGLFYQSPNLPDEVRQGLSSFKERRIKEARDLLQHIEVLIYLLKFKMKTFEKDMPLETFAKEWLSMLPSPFPVELLPKPSSSIKLMHITVLYEALEDLLADGAIEGLPDQFREGLTEEAEDKLSLLVGKDDCKLKLPSFLNALRRFVFRYLSSEKFLPDENTELNSSLKEPSLWSPGKPPDPEVIPKELTLQNINAIVVHLQELDKKRKGNSKRAGARQFSRENRVVSSNRQSQTGKSKRRVSGYSHS